MTYFEERLGTQAVFWDRLTRQCEAKRLTEIVKWRRRLQFGVIRVQKFAEFAAGGVFHWSRVRPDQKVVPAHFGPRPSGDWKFDSRVARSFKLNSCKYPRISSKWLSPGLEVKRFASSKRSLESRIGTARIWPVFSSGSRQKRRCMEVKQRWRFSCGESGPFSFWVEPVAPTRYIS